MRFPFIEKRQLLLVNLCNCAATQFVTRFCFCCLKDVGNSIIPFDYWNKLFFNFNITCYKRLFFPVIQTGDMALAEISLQGLEMHNKILVKVKNLRGHCNYYSVKA